MSSMPARRRTRESRLRARQLGLATLTASSTSPSTGRVGRGATGAPARRGRRGCGRRRRAAGRGSARARTRPASARRARRGRRSPSRRRRSARGPLLPWPRRSATTQAMPRAASRETRPRPRGRSSVRRSTIMACPTTATATRRRADDDLAARDASRRRRRPRTARARRRFFRSRPLHDHHQRLSRLPGSPLTAPWFSYEVSKSFETSRRRGTGMRHRPSWQQPPSD